MSSRLAVPLRVCVDAPRMLLSRVGTMCLVELQKMRRDRTELVARAVQPTLWLVVFGSTFTQLRAIPTGDVPYLDFLAPGVIAQSALFISIFYGIQIIWDRDAGILAKLMVTPTPRAALVTGKAFAAGMRASSPYAPSLGPVWKPQILNDRQKYSRPDVQASHCRQEIDG